MESVRDRVKDKHLCVLEFKRAELLYDVRNLGYITQEALQTAENDLHMLADIGEDGNADRVTRMLDVAHADVMHIVEGYTQAGVETCTYGNDVQGDSTSYFVNIFVKNSMPMSAINSLRIYIHDYMVNKVMEDWCSIVAPELQERWRLKLQEAKDAITAALNYRIGMVRIKQHPF